MTTQAYYFHSKDRQAGSSVEQAIYQLREPLNGKYMLKFMGFVNSLYNVNSYNNKIYFFENSTHKTATITPGNYSTSTLPAAVKAALDTASASYATFTVTISASTGYMTIASTQDFGLTFATNLTNSSARLLGYSFSDTATNVTSHSGSQLVNVVAPLGLLLNADKSQSIIRNASSIVSGSFIIPLNNGFGEYERFEPQSQSNQIYFHFRDGDLIFKINIYDLDGNIAGMNGCDYVLVLEKCVG